MSPPLIRPRPKLPATRRSWRQRLGGQAYRAGHGTEWIGALYLMLKGYQVLGFRLRTRGGEIDILARKGRVLVVVEVKRRAQLEEALMSVKPRQYERLLRAGQAVQRSKPSLQGHELRLDLLAFAPGRWPCHLKGLVQR